MISVFPNLNPMLFDYMYNSGQPTLNPLAQKQFQMALGEISRVMPVKWCVVGGDALRTDSPQAKIKIYIGVSERDLSNVLDKKYMITLLTRTLNRLNSNEPKALGTTNPVEYIVTFKPYTEIQLRDAYALLDNRWLKCSYVPVVSEKRQVKRPTSKRQYMQNIFRGIERRHPDYIPDIYKDAQFNVTHAKVSLDAAKRSVSGFWRISRLQALEVAKKYHLTHLPKRRKPYKMLGNTGIMLFRPKKQTFFLIKGPYTKKIKNAFRDIVYA